MMTLVLARLPVGLLLGIVTVLVLECIEHGAELFVWPHLDAKWPITRVLPFALTVLLFCLEEQPRPSIRARVPVGK